MKTRNYSKNEAISHEVATTGSYEDKTSQIKVYLSPSEKEDAQSLAAVKGLSTSDLFRRLLRLALTQDIL